jgi:hypothetical protein
MLNLGNTANSKEKIRKDKPERALVERKNVLFKLDIPETVFKKRQILLKFNEIE